MKAFMKILVMTLLLCLVASQAFASWMWNKKILKIQQAETGSFMAVGNADGSGMANYSLSPTNTDQMLAIALTAMSLSKNVHVELTAGKITSVVLSDE